MDAGLVVVADERGQAPDLAVLSPCLDAGLVDVGADERGQYPDFAA